jgi:hypothetical protein
MMEEERTEPREIETLSKEIVKKTWSSDRGDIHHSHLGGAFKGLEYFDGKKRNSRGSLNDKEVSEAEYEMGTLHDLRVANSSNSEISEPALSEEPQATQEPKAPKLEYLGYIATQDTIKPGLPEGAFDENGSYSFSDLSLEISNGNGVRHMARRVGNFLMEKGFEEPLLTNAIDFNRTETIVYYCNGYLQEAYTVAQEIPGYQNMEKVARFQRPGIKVRVLIGKDLVLFDPLFAREVPTS